MNMDSIRKQLGIEPQKGALRTDNGARRLLSFLAGFALEPLPIPWIPVLYNSRRHPAETMMYIVEHYDISHPPWSASGVGILSLFLDCHYSLAFPRALPTELKGVAV